MGPQLYRCCKRWSASMKWWWIERGKLCERKRGVRGLRYHSVFGYRKTKVRVEIKWDCDYIKGGLIRLMSGEQWPQHHLGGVVSGIVNKTLSTMHWLNEFFVFDICEWKLNSLCITIINGFRRQRLSLATAFVVVRLLGYFHYFDTVGSQYNII